MFVLGLYDRQSHLLYDVQKKKACKLCILYTMWTMLTYTALNTRRK